MGQGGPGACSVMGGGRRRSIGCSTQVTALPLGLRRCRVRLGMGAFLVQREHLNGIVLQRLADSVTVHAGLKLCRADRPMSERVAHQR